MTEACKSCGDEIDAETLTHWVDGPRSDGYGHKGLCCDCYDVGWGMSIASINRERAAQGKPPLNYNKPTRIE